MVLRLLTGGTSDDLAAARRGDRSAFARLFRAHARFVHGVLLSRVPAQDADDLVQDVFLKALESIGTLKAASFGPWIAAIARNRAVDHLRTRKSFDPLPDTLEVLDPRRSEALQALELIRALPEAYRETLVLRLVEGMTGPEIAAETGLTPDSVRVNLSRGMALLRERFGEEP